MCEYVCARIILNSQLCLISVHFIPDLTFVCTRDCVCFCLCVILCACVRQRDIFSTVNSIWNQYIEELSRISSTIVLFVAYN